MYKWTPVIIILLAVALLLFSFYGDNSYAKLVLLRGNLKEQLEQNRKLGDYVSKLKLEVAGLQRDPRTQEKAARNELGMARPNELIFVFEKKDRNKP